MRSSSTGLTCHFKSSPSAIRFLSKAQWMFGASARPLRGSSSPASLKGWMCAASTIDSPVGSRIRKPVAAQLTIDESAATAAGQQAPDEQRRGFWTAGVGVFVLWSLFTLLGAVLGDALGDPRRWGLDGAAVAAFLALLWPRLQQREPVALAVLCGVVTALAVPLVPPGLPILLAAVVGAAWGWWVRSPEAPSVREEAAT